MEKPSKWELGDFGKLEDFGKLKDFESLDEIDSQPTDPLNNQPTPEAREAANIPRANNTKKATRRKRLVIARGLHFRHVQKSRRKIKPVGARSFQE